MIQFKSIVSCLVVLVVLLGLCVMRNPCQGQKVEIVIPENVEMETKGYMNKIYFPTKHISKEEEQLFACVKTINDAFSEERDFDVIANRIRAACTELLGLQNPEISFSTRYAGKETVVINVIMLEWERSGCYCGFNISGPSKIEGGFDRVVQSVAVRRPNDEYRDLVCLFRENGGLWGIYYVDKDNNYVKDVKTWAKDGTFLDQKIVTKPIPATMPNPLGIKFD